MRAIVFLLLLSLAGCRASRSVPPQVQAAAIERVREQVRRNEGLDTGEFRWWAAEVADGGQFWHVIVPMAVPGTGEAMIDYTTHRIRFASFSVDKATGAVTLLPFSGGR